MSARNMAKRTAAGTLALAVCLGGGALALAGAANADANFQFSSRIQGADRYGTAIAASQAAFKDGSAQNVVIVNGYATVDGLTASYLAGVANAPILYVDQNGASDATKAELKRLGAKNIWLVGGTTVIPQSVQDAMSGAGYTVNRINGSDRYETAKLIAEAGAKMAGKQPAKVFVASGDSFADALAVSPIAYAKGYAIALTQKDTTSAFTTKELGNIGTNTKILVGGTAVVSDSVAQNLTVSQRIAGADRGVTANMVADYANSTEGFNASQAALVGGTDGNGADSLVGASVLGKTMTALHFAGWDSTTQWFKDHSAQLTGAGVIFGGKAAVSDGMVGTVQSAAQSVAAVAKFNVLSYNSMTQTLSYADPVAKTTATVTFKSTDKFMVDGNVASFAYITGSSSPITAGDLISWSKDSSGVTTYSIVNATVMSGLLGAFNTTVGAEALSIVDPSTGAALNATAYNYAPASALYMVNGTAVGLGDFKKALAWGAQVTVSGGTGAVGSPQTFSVTTQAVTGTVVAGSGSLSGGFFQVQTTTGAIFGGGSRDYSTASATLMLNGAVSNATTVNSHLTVGDTVTVTTSATGVQTIAVTDAAATSVTGVYKGLNGGTGKYSYFVGTGAVASVDTTTGVWTASGATTAFKVNGVLTTQSDFESKATAGSTLTYTAPDGTINTNGTVSLTTAPLTGTLKAGSSASAAIVLAGDGASTLATVNTGTGFYPTSTAQNYFVNGTQVTQTSFNSAISSVGSGSSTGSLTVVLNGTTTEYRVNTATAAATVATVGAGSVAGKTVTVTFNNPVYLSGTAAAADFAVVDDAAIGGAQTAMTVVSTNASTTLSGATASVTITLSTAPTNAKYVSVALTATGAAKFKDAAGNAAVANSSAVLATVASS